MFCILFDEHDRDFCIIYGRDHVDKISIIIAGVTGAFRSARVSVAQMIPSAAQAGETRAPVFGLHRMSAAPGCDNRVCS